jgi:hypothetical protein
MRISNGRQQHSLTVPERSVKQQYCRYPHGCDNHGGAMNIRQRIAREIDVEDTEKTLRLVMYRSRRLGFQRLKLIRSGHLLLIVFMPVPVDNREFSAK